MRRAITHRRGSVLILALCITLVLVSLLLVFCGQVSVDALDAADRVGSIQADAVERSAEAYCISLIDQQANIGPVLVMNPNDAASYFAGIAVGDRNQPSGYFWIVRPYYDNGTGQQDPSLPDWGLVDEESKINVNLAPLEMLELLPGLIDYPQIADAIVDWRDTDSTTTDQGAEDDYYMAMPQPYHCKNAPFDTMEELLLVRGMTRELLYGTSTGPMGMQEQTGAGNVGFGQDPQLAHGLYDLMTVYGTGGAVATGGAQGGANGGRTTGAQAAANVPQVNPLTACRSVLMCLPNMTAQDADAIIQARQGGSLDTSTTQWAVTALGAKGQQMSSYLTATSTHYTADIVAATADGRSFKHVRVVIDATVSPPQVVYRRDLTEQGWPLDPTILSTLRHEPADVEAGNTTTTNNRPGM